MPPPQNQLDLLVLKTPELLDAEDLPPRRVLQLPMKMILRMSRKKTSVLNRQFRTPSIVKRNPPVPYHNSKFSTWRTLLVVLEECLVLRTELWVPVLRKIGKPYLVHPMIAPTKRLWSFSPKRKGAHQDDHLLSKLRIESHFENR